MLKVPNETYTEVMKEGFFLPVESHEHCWHPTGVEAKVVRTPTHRDYPGWKMLEVLAACCRCRKQEWIKPPLGILREG